MILLGFRRRFLSIGLFVAAFLPACGDGGDNVDPPPTPAAIEPLSGDHQSGLAGTVLPEPIDVMVISTSGTPAAGITVTFSASGSGSVSPAATTTDANGHASTRWTLGVVTGPEIDTLRATVRGVDTPAVFTASVLAASLR